MHEVTLRSSSNRVEWPAGRKHQFVAVRQWVYARSVKFYDRGGIDAVSERLAIASSDLDLIAGHHVSQKAEMRIPVRGIDGDPSFAGIGREFDVTRAERQSLAAASGQDDG